MGAKPAHSGDAARGGDALGDAGSRTGKARVDPPLTRAMVPERPRDLGLPAKPRSQLGSRMCGARATRLKRSLVSRGRTSILSCHWAVPTHQSCD